MFYAQSLAIRLREHRGGGFAVQRKTDLAEVVPDLQWLAPVRVHVCVRELERARHVDLAKDEEVKTSLLAFEVITLGDDHFAVNPAARFHETTQIQNSNRKIVILDERLVIGI